MAGVQKSSFKAYLNDWEGRQWALLAGLLCGLGNGFQFMGGQAAGYAAADAVEVRYSMSSFPYIFSSEEKPVLFAFCVIRDVEQNIGSLKHKLWLSTCKMLATYEIFSEKRKNFFCTMLTDSCIDVHQALPLVSTF